MTALEKIIVELIEAEGPMPLARYMSLCLGHPLHGYYMTRDPFGAAGDFTTSPEISQVFGEMIGVWCVNTWMSMGQPSPVALVELGPGRGTLMADLLRAAKASPEFAAAVEVHLVEMSPVLQTRQREKLGVDITWQCNIDSLPNMPTIFVANEFFDALPIQQFEIRDGKTYARYVGLENGKLEMWLMPAPAIVGPDGVYEFSPISQTIVDELRGRIEACGGAALIIDYGHEKSAAGDTLQALHVHTFCSVFHAPGEVDITAHVDFEKFGPAHIMSQSAFLKAMGIEMRTNRLAEKLEGSAQADFLTATSRLISADEMGELFKVCCIVQKNANAPYPFEVS